MNWLTSKFKKVEVDCYLCGKKVTMSKWEDGSHRFESKFLKILMMFGSTKNILDALACTIILPFWKKNLVNSSYIVQNAGEE